MEREQENYNADALTVLRLDVLQNDWSAISGTISHSEWKKNRRKYIRKLDRLEKKRGYKMDLLIAFTMGFVFGMVFAIVIVYLKTL